MNDKKEITEILSSIVKNDFVDNPLAETMSAQFRTKVKKESRQVKDKSSGSTEMTPPYPFETLLQLYRINTYHARCINTKAALTCMLGYKITTNENNKQPDEQYNAIEAFLNKHSQYAQQSVLDTLYNFCQDKELYANAAFEIVRNGKGLIEEFYHIPMRYCRLKRRDNKTIQLIQRINAETVTFDLFGKKEESNNEFIFAKDYAPESDYYGVPAYIAALGAMVLDRSAVEYNVRRFENNLMLETIIKVYGAAFGADTKRNVKDFFSNNFKGIKKAGSSLLLEIPDKKKGEADIEVEKVSSENKDASFRMLRSDMKEEIVAAHEVPPRLVGIMNAGQLGDATEARDQMRMFRDLAIKPRQKRLEFIFNELILKNAVPENKKWKVELVTLDINDSVDDADFYDKIMSITDSNGQKPLDANEIREELGYPPRKEKTNEN